MNIAVISQHEIAGQARNDNVFLVFQDSKDG